MGRDHVWADGTPGLMGWKHCTHVPPNHARCPPPAEQTPCVWGQGSEGSSMGTQRPRSGVGGGSCPQPPEGAKRMAGAHAEGLPGSRQAEAALLGQPLLTLTQLGGPQQHPTPGRPWHTLHWAGQALASCSSRGGRVPRALGPSRVRDSSPPLPENSESWPGARAAERADDGTRTRGHTGTQAWGTHDRAHSGLAAAPGQSVTLPLQHFLHTFVSSTVFSMCLS